MLEPRDKNAMTVLGFLNTRPETFHLTGSRYFGNATESSDYDYFVQFSPKLLDSLLLFGFRVLTEPYHLFPGSDTSFVDTDRLLLWDQDIVHILRYIDDNKVQWDIQLVKDYNRRELVLRYLKCLSWYTTLSKDQRGELWRKMTEMYIRGKVSTGVLAGFSNTCEKVTERLNRFLH